MRGGGVVRVWIGTVKHRTYQTRGRCVNSCVDDVGRVPNHTLRYVRVRVIEDCGSGRKFGDILV